MNRPTLLGLLAAISALVLGAATIRTPQGLYSDPAYQIDALQEYLNGHSPSMNKTIKPSSIDLSKDQSTWIFWWPPGTQLLLCPFLKAGLPLGDAIRLLAFLFLMLGAVGWAMWISRFEFPFGWQVGLALILPWMRYASNSLFWFSAEIYTFGTAPWVLIGTLYVARLWKPITRPTPAAVVGMFFFGFILGFRYVLKYSAVFLPLGALVYLAAQCKSVKRGAARWLIVPASVGLMLPVVFMNVLNHMQGSAANGVVSTAGLNLSYKTILAALSDLALALADADGFFRFLLLHPVHGWFPHETALLFIGLPGGILIFWFLLRRQTVVSEEIRLARWAVLFTMGSLLLIWTCSAMASFEARHAASAALMLLPLVLQEAYRFGQTVPSKKLKIALGVVGVFYVATPLLYGFLSVGVKAHRIPRDYKLDSHKIYMPNLASHDLAGVRRRLLEDFDPDHDVWYLPDPMTAIALPGRTIVRQADFLSPVELRQDRFMTSRPIRIRALFPPSFERNGKAAIIRASFPQAGPWQRRTVDGCNYVLWTSTLNATPNHR